jgi:hypothetical protein
VAGSEPVRRLEEAASRQTELNKRAFLAGERQKGEPAADGAEPGGSSSSSSSGPVVAVTLEGAWEVPYFWLAGSYKAKIPIIIIDGVRREATPLELGCVAPTATSPEQLFDWQLMQLFCNLPSAGASKFITAFEAAQTVPEWQRGRIGTPQIDPRCVGFWGWL